MELCKLGLGRTIDPNDRKRLLKEIDEICGFNRSNFFPGAQPVTMCRESLVDLKEKDYYVCEKSDGLRALLYIKERNNKAYSFFIDRNCAFVQVNQPFLPCGSALLDGEIIQDKTGKYIYMVFDMLICQGRSVCEESLMKRLTMAMWYVQQSEKWRMKTQKVKPESAETPERPPEFEVKIKMMHKSYGLAEVYRKIIPTLEHENDGLIFTCVKYPYRPGTCSVYFKWKPPHLNSADFRIRKSVLAEDMYELLVMGNGGEVVFDWYWKDPLLSDLEENVKARKGAVQVDHYGEIENYDDLDNKIGEFSYKRKEYTVDHTDFSLVRGRWSLLRIREDKKTPNSYRTAVSVLESIRENLTYKELEKNVEIIRTNWKEREKEAENEKIRKSEDEEKAKKHKTVENILTDR